MLQVVEIAINSAEFRGEVVNVANGEEYFIKDVALIFFSLLECNFVFTGESLPGNPLNWKADTSLISNWGYNKRTDLKEGLEKYIEWIKKLR